MYKNKKILAIIPARGGSKRLPNKNILDLHGEPLIGWSIKAGQNSKYIDKVVVSSDSDKILDIATKYKVDILKRPDYLATDTANSIDVLKHVLENYKDYDYLILLQPTSPLRNEKLIDEAIELLDKKNADAIIGVTEMDHSPLWSNTLNKDLNMSNFLRDEVKGKRSQDLKKYYRINGAIYICKIDKFLEENNIFLKENIFAYVMDRKHSIDIDSIDDFEYAEFLVDNSIKLKKKITENIFQSYIRQGFGRLLKSEIDLIMFDFSLKMIFSESKPEYFINDELNYFVINKQDMYELSKRLKITENKISGYIEQIGLLKGLLDDKIGLENLKSLLLSQKQDKNNIDKGYLSIQVTNKLLRQFIEAKITSLGYQVEYGHNKDLIIFDLAVLLQIFDIKNEKFIQWIKNQKKIMEDEKLKEEFTKKDFDIKKLGKDISKNILSKFVGKSSDVLIDSFVDFIGKNLQK